MKIHRRHPWLARAVALLIAAVGIPVVVGTGVAEASIPGCLGGDIVGVASSASGAGYWLAGSDGGVFSYGDAPFYGSMGGKPLNQPVVGIVATASGQGYWLIAADGGVFAFGDARPPAANPLPGMHLNQPVVGAARSGTNGLELTAGDGGVFSLGGAPNYGSMAGHPLNKPVTGIAATASGHGYWLVAGDGGIFAFGDAQSPASNPLPGMHLNQPVDGVARVGTTGLELTAGDGGVFSLGGAPNHGSMGGKPLAKPVSGIATTPSGNGYLLAARDGGLFAFGAAGFFGNAVGNPSCNTPPPSSTGATIVNYATAIMNDKAEPGWAGGTVPYSWGGGHVQRSVGPSYGTCDGYTGPSPCRAPQTRGVDCSGFTRWVFRLAYGVDVLTSGNTNLQLSLMHKVTTPQPGDLTFYGTSIHNTHHVGIYIGNGKMINALKTGTNIEINNVNDASGLLGYWRY